ncbi:MAG TPA: hypothetical protein VFN10_22200 [Thermoanaerobaculia bacterium]|nr:hypothetical protein [Thermoanaerobaculia bacterium]
MRRVFSRGAVVLVVLVSLAVPAQARPLDDGWWAPRFVKSVKNWVVKTFGDQMSDPKP